MGTETDLVNHPPHYTKHPSGIECIQITEHMGFNLGNAVKYIWRADLKGNAIQDLEKAAWYVNREISRRKQAEKEATGNGSGSLQASLEASLKAIQSERSKSQKYTDIREKGYPEPPFNSETQPTKTSR